MMRASLRPQRDAGAIRVNRSVIAWVTPVPDSESRPEACAIVRPHFVFRRPSQSLLQGKIVEYHATRDRLLSERRKALIDRWMDRHGHDSDSADEAGGWRGGNKARAAAAAAAVAAAVAERHAAWWLEMVGVMAAARTMSDALTESRHAAAAAAAHGPRGLRERLRLHTRGAIRWALDNRRGMWRRAATGRRGGTVARFLVRYHVRRQRACLDEAADLVRGVLEQARANR
jgi:hypothetical protein